MSNSVALPTRIITYAWGEKYLGELLTFTLPAALAPGNLPYVASVTPCELVVLTQERSFASVTNNPAVARIRDLCPVKLISLDDLVVAPDKYGMALTCALHRGFVDLGPAVTDSWLMFLNADFIIADGSLRSLLSRLAAGERLVAAPSYCVNADAVVPMLLGRSDPQTHALSLSHRELASLVLRHRHNTIRGKTVNQSLFSIRLMDQFYWQVDRDTLLGHQMPIAIVGMRPERYLAEPNSQWDHGLMKEFVPEAAPSVIGDSDEFLMMELRSEQVAEDQLRLGWADPAEIAGNTRSFLTAYQKNMAQYPLTLHARDLPADVETARQSLRDYMNNVLAHVPAVLPSHLDHPQWDYHRSSFIKGQHDYLSKQLGRATAENEPPVSLSEVHRLWWKLDGLNKSYERRRAELTELYNHRQDALTKLRNRTEAYIRLQKRQLGKKLVAELSAIPIEQASEHGEIKFDQVFVRARENTQDDVAGGRKPPFAPLNAEAWKAFEIEAQARRGAIARALEWVEGDYESRLGILALEHQSARRPLQSAYDRLANRGVTSAAVPNVVISRGPQFKVAAPITARNPQSAVVGRVYRRFFGAIPRVKERHPYWAPLRHLVRLVDHAASEGAANVLVVVGTIGVADRIADALPGLHAAVSRADALQGNIAAAFNRSREFDLCVCTLDAAEMYEFSALVKAVEPCLREGAKVIGFYPNFDLTPLPTVDAKLVRGLFNVPGIAKVYYAGSAASAQVLRRFRKAIAFNRGHLRISLRIAGTLFLLAPRTLAANRLEGQIAAEQASRLPPICSSITIEVTV